MSTIDSFLLSLLSTPGLSGFEEPVSKIIEEKWRPLVDEISSSPLGSLHALRRTAGEKSPSILIAAHMDAIGLMVKDIADDLLWVTHIGGVDPRILPGQAVTVHGRHDLPGIVQMLPDRLVSSKDSGNPPGFSRLFIDMGLKGRELKKLVRIGDIVSFAQLPIDFKNNHIAGHSLDNRASIAALTVCLEEIKNFNLQWNLWAVATVQEEEHLIGAFTSAYQLMPNVGIAIDVTFASGPGANDHQCFPLGKGPTIGIGGNIHPLLNDEFVRIAKELDMPFSVETMPRSSGTDSMAMQITAAGIPTMVLGIPIRYMHTPLELVSISDIRRAGRLAARFITSLEKDSLRDLIRGPHL